MFENLVTGNYLKLENWYLKINNVGDGAQLSQIKRDG